MTGNKKLEPLVFMYEFSQSLSRRGFEVMWEFTTSGIYANIRNCADKSGDKLTERRGFGIGVMHSMTQEWIDREAKRYDGLYERVEMFEKAYDHARSINIDPGEIIVHDDGTYHVPDFEKIYTP